MFGFSSLSLSPCPALSLSRAPPLNIPRDTLNTPFFGDEGNFPEFTANGILPGDSPYAPIPSEYIGEGDETTYTWPLPGSEGYYSVMYSGIMFVK